MSPLTITGIYPNPFNMSTTISYKVQSDCCAKLVIYDILGRKVTELHNGTMRPGIFESVWNGKNDYGETVGSGVYFCSFKTDRYMARGKMLLMK
ncbi:MAG: T9SS type A sorting domain-containing protein [Candidatus Latescibacteria bacterium]|nr:T9SS type A sorting domain-containing protein [Candidatus Latescibacterota bacterium]